MSLQYRNKSKSQLTSPTPAQLPAVAVSSGHIVHILFLAVIVIGYNILFGAWIWIGYNILKKRICPASACLYSTFLRLIYSNAIGQKQTAKQQHVHAWVCAFHFFILTEFVAALEAKNYPIWATQFHPEKNAFEWTRKYDEIPHSIEAMETSAFFAQFFVEQTRLNNHQFESRTIEEEHLIYNFDPKFTGKQDIDYVMQQCYLF
jgi:hypothetical protein